MMNFFNPTKAGANPTQDGKRVFCFEIFLGRMTDPFGIN